MRSRGRRTATCKACTTCTPRSSRRRACTRRLPSTGGSATTRRTRGWRSSCRSTGSVTAASSRQGTRRTTRCSTQGLRADEHGRSSRCPEVQVERDGADAQYGVTAGVRDDRQSGTMKIKTELPVLLGILSE
ncbi:hypothetical protein VPH35_095411 [Triticum aestivum]